MLDVLLKDLDTGLVLIDNPATPRAGYGFTDTIAKTGKELFCSLLVFEALTSLMQWVSKFKRSDIYDLSKQWHEQIQNNLSDIWDNTKQGMFYAASEDCW